MSRARPVDEKRRRPRELQVPAPDTGNIGMQGDDERASHRTFNCSSDADSAALFSLRFHSARSCVAAVTPN